MRRRTLNMVQMVGRSEAKSNPEYNNITAQNEHNSSENNSKVQHWISSDQEYLYMGPGSNELKEYTDNTNYQPYFPIVQKLYNNESNIIQTKDNLTQKSFEENCDDSVPIYSHDGDVILENSVDESVVDNDDKDKDYLPYSPVIHESSSNESDNSQFPDEAQNTFEENNDENDVSIHPHSRKFKQIRKQNRQNGLSYTTAKGKNIRARSSDKELVACRMKCKDWLQKIKADIFKEYWSLGSRTRKVDFIGSAVTKKNVVSSRKRNQNSLKKRNVTYEYYFNCDGKPKMCCKKCFLTTLDENEKFVRSVIENKNCSVSGITKLDGRGKRLPVNKTTDEAISNIQKHISSFPTYQSHYTRRTNDAKYLPAHLNLTLMYKLYRSEIQVPVSKAIYEREFKKTKLKFKLRKADTCHKCDVFKMKIEMETNDEEKNKLIKERDCHVKNADDAYNNKRVDKEKAKLDPSIICQTFDLQQCLPTPFLETSVAFYKRLYWTYNLSTHNLATGQASCYLWHESIARRGANEIASCIYKELLSMPNNVITVILYSDSCAGQNKNSYLSAMFFTILKNNSSIQQINHKFLIPGHTHMECDTDHSLIEKQKKRSALQIAHPRDWATLISCTNKKKPFHVHEMKQENFFDFEKLLKGPLVVRKKDEDGNIFIWHDVAWLQYRSDNIGFLYYKTSLSEDEPFKVLNLKRRSGVNNFTLQKMYNAPVPISKEKKRDLLQLLTLIPNIYHDFYKNLKDDNTESQRYDPDLDEISIDNDF